MKSDQSLVFEHFELDFPPFPLGKLRANPRDVDVCTSGVGDEVEAVVPSNHYQLFHLATMGAEKRKPEGKKGNVPLFAPSRDHTVIQDPSLLIEKHAEAASEGRVLVLWDAEGGKRGGEEVGKKGERPGTGEAVERGGEGR